LVVVSLCLTDVTSSAELSASDAEESQDWCKST